MLNKITTFPDNESSGNGECFDAVLILIGVAMLFALAKFESCMEKSTNASIKKQASEDSLAFEEKYNARKVKITTDSLEFEEKYKARRLAEDTMYRLPSLKP